LCAFVTEPQLETNAAARQSFRPHEALGFERLHDLRATGDDSSTLLGLDDVDLEAVYLLRDGVCIELLHYVSPGSVESDPLRPMNQVGFTHLSMRVADLDAALEAVVHHGGHLLPETTVRHPEFKSAFAFVTDPDGTRVELLQVPGDPAKLPGA
jgi:glyoxylase I family protein